MIRWIKNNLQEIGMLLARSSVVGILVGIVFFNINFYDETKLTIIFDQEQIEKLKEISKKDFRDVNHTLLMLADDYIKYHENNELVK
jgi:hypothetical protein